MTSSNANDVSNSGGRETIARIVQIAIEHHQAGRVGEAEQLYRQVLEDDPRNFDALHLLGVIAVDSSQYDLAIDLINQALQSSDGKNPFPHYNLGIALMRQGRLDDAVTCFKNSIALKPDYAEAHNNLGNVLADQGKLEEAANCFYQALTLKTEYPEAYNNLGTIFKDQGMLIEAQNCYQEALRLNPNYANALNNLGNVFYSRNELERAIEKFRQTLALKPGYAQARNNLAMALLANGHIAEGWEHYDERFVDTSSIIRHHFPQPHWAGEDLKDKGLLIWGEQGLGEEILFSCLFQQMSSRVGRCVIECKSKLVPLFRRSFPTAEVVAASDPPHSATMEALDFQCAAGSLPRWLNAGPASLTHSAGHLQPVPERVAFWRERLRDLGSGLKIGISWRSSRLGGARHLYCTTLDQWAPIFSIPGVHFVNLQYDDCADELSEVRQRFGVVVHAFQEVDLLDDIDETAALTQALDLVITAPTSPSFLAGAVGVPTWMMTYGATWETLGTDHLPWFPMVRLFTRRWDQTWESVLSDIAVQLQGFS